MWNYEVGAEKIALEKRLVFSAGQACYCAIRDPILPATMPE